MMRVSDDCMLAFVHTDHISDNCVLADGTSTHVYTCICVHVMHDIMCIVSLREYRFHLTSLQSETIYSTCMPHAPICMYVHCTLLGVIVAVMAISHSGRVHQ